MLMLKIKNIYIKKKSDKNEPHSLRISYLKEYQFLASTRLTKTIERIGKITSTFSGLLKNIDNRIDRQSKSTLTSEKICLDTKPYFARIKDQSKTIKSIAENSLVISTQGKKVLVNTIVQINNIIGSVYRFNEIIEKFKGQSDKIQSISKIITNIADNTKTIAINSTITAHKAGELGKGFTVVAGEIKSLSIQTSEQTEIINQRISVIRNHVNKLIEQMTESMQNAEKTKSVIEDASSGMNDIVSAISEADRVSTLIYLMADKLDHMNLGILDQIKEMIVYTKKMSEDSEKCLSDIELQTDSIANLQNISKTSIDITEECRELLKDHKNTEQVLSYLLEFSKNYDPATAHYAIERNFVEYFNIKLAKNTTAQSIVPCLAETWVLADDEKTWHFKIKENVKFYNGHEITTEDIKFSFERVLNPEMRSVHADTLSIFEGADDYIKGRADEVTGIQIKNKYEISFKLKRPYNYFLSLLTQTFASVIQKNPEYLGKPFKIEKMVTAGPFRYSGYDTGKECFIFKANKDYIDGRPYVDKMLIYNKIRDNLEAFKKRKIDISFSIPSDKRREIRKIGYEKYFKTFQARRVNGLHINFLKDNYITKHKKIRHALSHAIDKKRILIEAYKNTAAVANSVLQASIYGIPDKKYFKYDPDRAKKIFQSFRSKEDLAAPVSILIVENPKLPFLEKSAEIIYENLKNTGLNIHRKRIPFNRLSIDDHKNYELCYLSWIPDLDLYLALEAFINPLGGDNWFNYENPELFDHLNNSLHIKDPGNRKEYFIKLMDQFCDDVFMIPVVHLKYNYVHHPIIKNVKVTTREDPDMKDIWIDRYYQKNRNRFVLIKHDFITPVIHQYKNIMHDTSRSILTVKNNSTQLINTVKDIISLVNKQKISVERINNTIADFKNLSIEADNQTKSTLQTIDAAIDETEKGENISAAIMESLEILKNNMTSTLDVINLFNNDIKIIIETIKQMKQTAKIINSIAINAAIIGAQKSQWRDDFSSISSEVRKLSTDTKNEIDKISSLVEKMNSIINDVAAQIKVNIENLNICINHANESQKGLTELNEVTSKAGSVSDIILKDILELSKRIENISTGINEINLSSLKINNMAESVTYGSRLQTDILDVLNDNFMDYKSIFKEFTDEIKYSHQ